MFDYDWQRKPDVLNLTPNSTDTGNLSWTHHLGKGVGKPAHHIMTLSGWRLDHCTWRYQALSILPTEDLHLIMFYIHTSSAHSNLQCNYLPTEWIKTRGCGWEQLQQCSIWAWSLKETYQSKPSYKPSPRIATALCTCHFLPFSWDSPNASHTSAVDKAPFCRTAETI